MKTIYLDLMTDYIPFTVQCTNGVGEVEDPTSYQLRIYEDECDSGNFSNTEISGSPFNLQKIDAKTGLWGVMVSKSLFTAGNIYRAYWEITVDETETAKVENYLACNAADFTSSENLVLKYQLVDSKSYKPLKNAEMSVTRDEAGLELIRMGTTDDEGYFYFDMNSLELNRTYYFWRKKAGYEFKNPEEQNILTALGKGAKVKLSDLEGTHPR